LARAPLIVVLLMLAIVGACGGAANTTSPSGSAIPIVAISTNESSTPSPSALTATPSPTGTAHSTPTLEPTPAPWKTFRSKQYHYAITYPPGWHATAGGPHKSDVIGMYGPPRVYISRDADAATGALSLTVEADIAYTKSHYRGKVVSNKAIKLAGYSGRLITYEIDRSGLQMVSQSLIIAKGHTMYFMTLEGLAYLAKTDDATFRKVYKSFKPT
jgi:hypothetical protein